MEVPVLKVGDKHVKGFDPNRWNTVLDEGGYPKSNPPLRDRKNAGDASDNTADKPAPIAQPQK
jgi:hypothetical protein